MKHKKDKKKKKRRSPSVSSSCSSQDSNEWVEKSPSATTKQTPSSAEEKIPTNTQKPPPGSSLGFSFLDLALSSSSFREKKEKPCPVKTETIELPIGLYYPNKKQNNASLSSTNESKDKESDRVPPHGYDSHRKHNISQSDRHTSRRFQKPDSSDDESSYKKNKYSKTESYSSRQLQKPDSSDDERSHKKDKYSKSERHSSRQFQTPDGSDDERSHKKDKYSKSERHSSKQFQKPDGSDDERSHKKDKYSKSERHSSKQFQKPDCSDDERSHKKDKYSKSERHSSKQFQKPDSSDDERSHKKDKYSKSERHSSKQFQKPDSSDDERSHKKDKYSKSERHSSKQFQKPDSSDDERSQKNDKYERYSRDRNQSKNEEECISTNSTHTEKRIKDRDDESRRDDVSSAPNISVSHDDVNKLAAKLIKAEMMGNTELVAKLKAKLETAKSQEVVVKRNIPQNTKPGENNGQVVVVSEQNMKDRRRTELLERKKLAFLGDNEDRWVSEGKSFANIGDEYEEEDAPRKKKPKTVSSASHANTHAIQDHKRTSEMLSSCQFCLSSASKQHPILIDQVSEEVYLALPARSPLVTHHCVIVTQDHVASLRQTDPSTYSSIRATCEKLVTQFARAGKTCVFFEMVCNLKWNHCHVHCVPLDREEGDMAPLFFQKAISDLEADTRHNRTLTKIQRNKLLSSIPMELEYFYVNFDWGEGFAHIIENKMSNTFAEEIIGGMLDLNPSLWRKLTALSYEAQMKNKLDFLSVYRGD